MFAEMLGTRRPSVCPNKGGTRRRRRLIFRAIAFALLLLLSVIVVWTLFVDTLWRNVGSWQGGAHHAEYRSADPLLAQIDLHNAGAESPKEFFAPFPYYLNYPSLQRSLTHAAARGAVHGVGGRQRVLLRNLPAVPETVVPTEVKAGMAETEMNTYLLLGGRNPSRTLGANDMALGRTDNLGGHAWTKTTATPLPERAPVCIIESTMRKDEAIASGERGATLVNSQFLAGTDDMFFDGRSDYTLTPMVSRHFAPPQVVPVARNGQSLRNGVILFFSPHFTNTEAVAVTEAETQSNHPGARFLHTTLPKLEENFLQSFPYPVHIFHRGPMPAAIVNHIARTLKSASAVFIEDVQKVIEDEATSPSSHRAVENWFREQEEAMIASLTTDARLAADAVASAEGAMEGAAVTHAARQRSARMSPPAQAPRAVPLPSSPSLTEPALQVPLDLDDLIDFDWNTPVNDLRTLRRKSRLQPERFSPHSPLEIITTPTTTTTTVLPSMIVRRYPDNPGAEEAPQAHTVAGSASMAGETTTELVAPTSEEIVKLVKARLRKARTEWQVRRFWVGTLARLPSLSRYEMYWRLDADAVLGKPVASDVFAVVADQQCAAGYHSLEYATHKRVLGFWDTLEKWRRSMAILVQEHVRGEESHEHHDAGRVYERHRTSAGHSVRQFSTPTDVTLLHPILYNNRTFLQAARWLRNGRMSYSGKAYSSDFQLGNFALLRHPLYASFFTHVDNQRPLGLLRLGWSDTVVHTVMSELITEQEGWNVCEFTTFAGYKYTAPF